MVGDSLRSDPQDGYDFETLKNSHGFCMFFGPVVDSYMFFNVNNPVLGEMIQVDDHVFFRWVG